MTVLRLFSYRKKVAQGEQSDVFIYDSLPQALRVQIIHIWREAIGPYVCSPAYDIITWSHNNAGWITIEKQVAREHGLFDLSTNREASAFDRCANYLLNNQSTERAIDLIERSFQYIDHDCRAFNDSELRKRGITVSPCDAIVELNERFRRAGVGYQFESGTIMRVDSELIHSEIVKPALQFLHQKGFEGPRDEFLQAYSHHKAGKFRDAITNANNSFESTLKAICDQRNWNYPSTARARDLLSIVRTNKLFPTYLDNSFDQLVATLKNGLPEVRNNEGSHGQGSKTKETPSYVAAYALHLTAANILFLSSAHEATE